jgi:hypothetical protein
MPMLVQFLCKLSKVGASRQAQQPSYFAIREPLCFSH